ncbi:MAG: hypothetical protein ABI647_00780 [Gemmatimonadota bacterium]
MKLAAALRADSLPVSRIRPFDGYLETPWFDALTLEPTSRRPVGPNVVKVRAWVDPAKPSFSSYEVEGVYVAKVDPSRPARELEVPLPIEHPLSKRLAAVVKKLVAEYGEPEEPPPGPVRPARALGDTLPAKAKPDSTPPAAKTDTTPPRAKSDTTPLPRPKRDTTAAR